MSLGLTCSGAVTEKAKLIPCRDEICLGRSEIKDNGQENLEFGQEWDGDATPSQIYSAKGGK